MGRMRKVLNFQEPSYFLLRYRVGSLFIMHCFIHCECLEWIMECRHCMSFLTLGKLSDIAKNELNFGQLSVFDIIH